MSIGRWCIFILRRGIFPYVTANIKKKFYSSKLVNVRNAGRHCAVLIVRARFVLILKTYSPGNTNGEHFYFFFFLILVGRESASVDLPE